MFRSYSELDKEKGDWKWNLPGKRIIRNQLTLPTDTGTYREASLRNKKLLSTCNHLFYLIIIIKCYFTTQTKTKIQFRSFQS